MEYASGGSLRNYIEQNTPKGLPISQAVTILLQISLALEYAHRQGVVHRDVKPNNVLFDETGDVLLADFGIAVMLDPGTNEAHLDTAGTPAYMAPECLIRSPPKDGLFASS